MVERIQFTPEDDDDDDSPEVGNANRRTRRRSGYEALTAENRQKEAEKIAKSLENSPLFGERKADKVERPTPKHLKKPRIG